MDVPAASVRPRADTEAVAPSDTLGPLPLASTFPLLPPIGVGTRSRHAFDWAAPTVHARVPRTGAVGAGATFCGAYGVMHGANVVPPPAAFVWSHGGAASTHGRRAGAEGPEPAYTITVSSAWFPDAIAPATYVSLRRAGEGGRGGEGRREGGRCCPCLHARDSLRSPGAPPPFLSARLRQPSRVPPVAGRVLPPSIASM
jgi:hypothetical protein